MNIVFRTDASLQMGTGHVMRCLTLADVLRDKGAQCFFLCRQHEGNLLATVRQRGFEVVGLPACNGKDAGKTKETCNLPSHAAWLGCDWQTDAQQSAEIIASAAPDWLIVDHYALDARWEKALKPCCRHLMVIDDLADRLHLADVLLDQNALHSEIDTRYQALVDPDCKLLLGPQYALLGQEFRFLAKALPERDGQVTRILVFVGGSDPHHLTERYLNALNIPELQHLLVDVVIGKNHPAPQVVSNLVASRNGTRLYSGLPSLSALMIRADLMLGAGGATNWERLCLGLNSIVVSVARNQDEINRELAEKGLIQFLGKAEHVTVENICAALRRVIISPSDNCAKAKRMRKIVDGRGCQRVVEALLE